MTETQRLLSVVERQQRDRLTRRMHQSSLAASDNDFWAGYYRAKYSPRAGSDQGRTIADYAFPPPKTFKFTPSKPTSPKSAATSPRSPRSTLQF